MAELQKLADNWDALTDSEKIALFNSTNGEQATIEQLRALNKPFQILYYTESDAAIESMLMAIPHTQLILQKDLFILDTYAALNTVTISSKVSDSAVLKLAVTLDGNIYYVYTDKVWTALTNTSNNADKLKTEIESTGNTVAEINALTVDDWSKLLINNETQKMSENIGFAYLLGIPSLDDSVEVTSISFNVDNMASNQSAINGTNYTYSYLGQKYLTITIKTAGTYLVNYTE